MNVRDDQFFQIIRKRDLNYRYINLIHPWWLQVDTTLSALEKLSSCFNQQGQVVAMETYSYTSKKGTISWVSKGTQPPRDILS